MRLHAALAVLSISAALPVSLAHAADLLPPVPNLEDVTQPDFTWEGLYGGIHAGAGTAEFKRDATALSRDTVALATQSLAGLPVAPLAAFATVGNSSSANSPLVGGFVGYNRMFDDAMVGFEVGFSHFTKSFEGTATNSQFLVEQTGTGADVLRYTASSTSKLGDYLDLRFRGGFAWDRVLFYGTLGAVVAQQRVTTVFSGNYTTYDLTGTATGSGFAPARIARNSGYNWGLSAGVGVDVAVIDNVFARLEYEYIGMTSTKGLTTSAHLGKLGIGFKY